MKSDALLFDRPERLQATAPPENHGLNRDEVRLLVTTSSGSIHARFSDLHGFLVAGDLLVVNESATIPASLPAKGSLGNFVLNLSTNYGNGLWLAEPRWSASEPGPLPLQGGRSWTNALADVDEGIDHLAYSDYQLLKLQPRLADDYRPRGVVATIPPWNFPATLPMEMTGAALATGNAVVLKSAEQTPVIAHKLVQILHEAGVPKEALIHLPGRGDVTGDYLVGSPKVEMVAFTGSKQVGLSIYRKASAVRLEKGGLKKVVAELGGKNPIIVFPDADMDEAVHGILMSTFEHANQQCSACSRAFVHSAVAGRLRRRLVEASRTLAVGRSG